ncbi:MAG: zinc dependent phospholipase C family protein [Porcipelethomonas sp.]
MKTRDHIILAEIMVKKYMQRIPQSCKNAFILGNAGPDLNLFSYLKGTFSAKPFMGHNYENSQKYMKKLINKLTGFKKPGVQYYYNLGVLVHYLADSFTFAHNSIFGNSIKGHSEYEYAIHKIFCTDRIKIYSCLSADFRIMECYDDWIRLHDNYVKEKMSVDNDMIYIFLIANSFVKAFVRLPDVSVCRRAALA